MAKAACKITGAEELDGELTLTQTQEDAPTIIDGQIRGLAPGLHGFHVHCFGDFLQDADGAGCGPIFNPFSKAHGAPDDDERMVGSLGNIEAGEDGIANVHIEDRLVKLIGPHSVIGRSITVKAGQDDLGKGGHELSQMTGNSGGRLGGGVIGISH